MISATYRTYPFAIAQYEFVFPSEYMAATAACLCRICGRDLKESLPVEGGLILQFIKEIRPTAFTDSVSEPVVLKEVPDFQVFCEDEVLALDILLRDGMSEITGSPGDPQLELRERDAVLLVVPALRQGTPVPFRLLGLPGKALLDSGHMLFFVPAVFGIIDDVPITVPKEVIDVQVDTDNGSGRHH